MDAVTKVMENGMEARALAENGILAELSRIAALATARLDQASSVQDAAGRDLTATRAMLQEIETAGHRAYLAKHGTEEDYQAVGAKVEKRYRTPSGKWRG